jgi:hypothetical protein
MPSPKSTELHFSKFDNKQPKILHFPRSQQFSCSCVHFKRIRNLTFHCPVK